MKALVRWPQVAASGARLNLKDLITQNECFFSDQCCCLVDKNGVFLCRNVAQ